MREDLKAFIIFATLGSEHVSVGELSSFVYSSIELRHIRRCPFARKLANGEMEFSFCNPLMLVTVF